MSGGSWDYLENAFLPGSNRFHDVERMADELAADGFTVAAEEMRKLARLGYVLEQRWESLAPVMHAVEWRDSHDWGDALKTEVIQKWAEGLLPRPVEEDPNG